MVMSETISMLFTASAPVLHFCSDLSNGFHTGPRGLDIRVFPLPINPSEIVRFSISGERLHLDSHKNSNNGSKHVFLSSLYVCEESK